MKLQNLSLEQLKEIVDGAPEGATHVDLNLDTSGLIFYKDEPNQRLSIRVRTKWLPSFRSSVDETNLIKLSDIRTRITELEPEFKVGDRVVHVECSPLRGWYAQIATILKFEPSTACIEYADGVTSWIDLSFIRHATPAEIAAGHRIDEPSSSCGMSGAEIDQFGEDLRSKPYVDFYEFEQADCEACRASLGTIRDYMIVCPDCGNKRCPQALNHRYKCTGSNAVNQAGELKEPDTITTQLDPAKCHKVDPALAYDSPSDCPKDDFDAMSEKHRSPSCKCQEFPIDAELKPDPFQQAKNKQQEEISQGKCGEFMAGYDRGFLTAWNERQDEIDSCGKIAQALVQLEMQKNRQLQERINDLERRNRAFHEKNVDLERSCKMQHAEWSHMKQLLDKALKGEQGE